MTLPRKPDRWTARLCSVFAMFALASCTANAPELPSQGRAPAVVPLMEPGAQQGAACPDEVSPGCAEAAMRESLDILSAHGLDPSAYLAIDDVRAAWLLAATHLSRGAVDIAARSPRQQADPALSAILEGMSPEDGPAAYRAALQRLAPATPVYEAISAELLRLNAAIADKESAQPDAETGERILSLKASLERLRHLPREASPRQVYANIPGFEVIAYAGAEEASRRRAIFGQTGRQTPEFSDAIEFIVLNPWWEVPASIARADKLPQFRRDPGAVARLGYQILDRGGQRVDPSAIDWAAVPASPFPYRIRQAPGPANALGQAKFMFPNPHDVYLHDTPDRALFERTQRTFSSGCIRVENPIDLAEWALDETPGWDRERIEAALATGRETRADLAAPLPIHIVYLTAFPAADGRIAYAPDVYGRNADLLTALGTYTPQGIAEASQAEPLRHLAASDMASTDTAEPHDSECQHPRG